MSESDRTADVRGVHDHDSSALVVAAALILALVIEGCGARGARGSGPTAARSPFTAANPETVLLVGAGDVGDEGHHSDLTYALIRRIFERYGGAECPGGECAGEPDGGSARGRVFVAGDDAYPSGTVQDFIDNYATSWGHLIRNSWPAIGNHEYADYNRHDAGGYFDYFSGTVTGFPEASPAPLNRPDGWYDYDWGQWKIIVLNSSCNEVDCAAENIWLKNVLAASVAGEASGTPKCQLVYAHHPRFSDCLPASEGGTCPGSGDAGGAGKRNNPFEKYLWHTMYDYGVDVFVSGHDHGYQRFPRLNKDEPPAQDDRGVRQYVAGSGGKDLYGFDRTPLPPRIVQGFNVFGVVVFELHPTAYRSAFRPADTVGDPELDVNETACHASNVPAGQ